MAAKDPNYIKLINWFWDEVIYLDGYRPLYGILFFAITDSINRNAWRNNTPIFYENIFIKSKLSKEVFLKGRDWLAMNNLIEFTAGKNNMQVAVYSIGSAVGITTGNTTSEETAGRPVQLPVSLPINTKPETNKLKTTKPETLNIPFNDFWDLYDKKIGKKKAENEWYKLTDEERETAIKHIPAYKESTSDKKFLFNADNYLRDKHFNDEILTHERSNSRKGNRDTGRDKNEYGTL